MQLTNKPAAQEGGDKGDEETTMGVPRLKIKCDHNYRRGGTAHNCSCCNHFVGDFEVKLIGGEIKSREPRCRVIGLEMGRTYKINPENICDRYDNSSQIKRLRRNP